jgi:hypothetical protein
MAPRLVNMAHNLSSLSHRPFQVEKHLMGFGYIVDLRVSAPVTGVANRKTRSRKRKKEKRNVRKDRVLLIS